MQGVWSYDWPSTNEMTLKPMAMTSTSVKPQLNTTRQGTHGKIITSIIKYGMNLLIHTHTLTVALLKFGNGKLIYPTVYWACDYLSMLELKFNHFSERGPMNHVHIYWNGITCKIDHVLNKWTYASTH